MNASLETYANKVLAAPMESQPGGMTSAAEPVMTAATVVTLTVAAGISVAVYADTVAEG